MTGRTLAFCGSLNQPVPYFPASNGRGISVLDFDERTGRLTPLSHTDRIANPSFLALHPQLPVLYATSEVYDRNEGTVTAYRVDPETGRLVYLNNQPTLGSVAAHAHTDRQGGLLFVANYRNGAPGDLPGQSVVAFPLRADGSLGPACASAVHAGSGPVADRQDGPHPHCVLPSLDGRFLCAADLGTDEVIAYRVGEAGSLDRAASVSLPPGTGPRHLAWHNGGTVLYAIGELNQTVAVLVWDEGRLRHVQTLAAVPQKFSGVNYCADLHAAADGRFVYGSNRGHDSIAVFAADAAGLSLRPAGHYSALGACPRSFCLDPSERFLLIANQASDAVIVLLRDPETGALSDSGERAELGTPMCVKMRRY